MRDRFEHTIVCGGSAEFWIGRIVRAEHTQIVVFNDEAVQFGDRPIAADVNCVNSAIVQTATDGEVRHRSTLAVAAVNACGTALPMAYANER